MLKALIKVMNIRSVLQKFSLLAVEKMELKGDKRLNAPRPLGKMTRVQTN